MNALPYLFLDIDGVLVKMGGYPSTEEFDEHIPKLFPKLKDYERARGTPYSTEELTFVTHYFSESAVSNLHSLIDRVNVNIVITSTWRRHGDVDTLRGILSKHSFSQLIIGKTPSIPICDRGFEISHWLTVNKKTENPYAIIDDVDDNISRKHTDRFVLVNRDKLFTAEDADRAYQMLTTPISNQTIETPTSPL